MTQHDDLALRPVADALFEADRAVRPIAPVREQLPDSSVATAYQVQQINTRRALAAGRRLVGRKIGLTSFAVQQQLGVDQPDFGALFADMAVGDGEPIRLSRLIQPKVEAEIALVLKAGLDTVEPTLADVISATDYALAAIEVVDSRIADWNIRLADTIADNASSALFVLGSTPVPLSDLNLHGCRMSMNRDGQVVSSGSGAACLGNPLNAAVWLARTMARNGSPLRAGDVILTGALGPMVAVSDEGVFEAVIDGLGSVRAAFIKG